MQKTVFDVGMYDGADTEYYLHKGFNVVAIEANPELANRARLHFSQAISDGRLIIENVAIAPTNGPLELNLSVEDLGSSTIVRDVRESTTGWTRVTVDGVRFTDLLEKHGVPHYLKVDIEGCDEICIRSLGRNATPAYVSFEMGGDALELAEHLRSLGYHQFKIISQSSFSQLRQHGLKYRIKRRIRTIAGYREALLYERDQWKFTFEHSSGPMGEATSGAWQSFATICKDWRRYGEHRSFDIGGWFDLHAKLPG